SYGSFSQTWDAENRLVTVTETGSGQTTTFAYDPDGQRVATITPNSVIYSPYPYYEEEVSLMPMGEVGLLDDILTHTPKTIMLAQNYNNPVVFAQPLSRDGGDTAVVRITDVRSDRFTLYIQEAPNKDGGHTTEAVSYLVLEAGNWLLPDGTQLEVGRQTTAATVGPGINNQWLSVNFTSNFKTTPVVISQVQTNNDPYWVKTRQQNSSVSGVQIAMEQDSGRSNVHGAEIIGWLAIEPGTGNWAGHLFEAGNTADVVTHNWHQLNFSQNFAAKPRVAAAIATYDGGDPAHLRYDQASHSPEGVRLYIEEDTVTDSEINHTTEVVSYLAVEGDGILKAIDNGLTQRITYAIAGQTVAVRVTGDPDPANNGLHHLYTDHLGS
ncbi:MAG: hypothetical protein D6706_05180, partial [Chloroflexi bacterium]